MADRKRQFRNQAPRANNTDACSQRSQSVSCFRHGQYRSAKAATAAASATGHSASNAETAGFNIPYADNPLWFELSRLFAPARSQMSAAIEPTTPIAANPENASISGTGLNQR